MKFILLLIAAFPFFAQAQYCEDEARVAALLNQDGEMNCLDSRTEQKGLALENKYVFHKSLQRDEWLIVYTEVNGVQKDVVTIKLNEENNPRGCGQYLIGVRLLPGKSEMLFLYAHNVMRYINLSGEIKWTFDNRPKSMGFTCEGRVPNKNAERENILIEGDLIKATILDRSRKVRACDTKEELYDLANPEEVASLRFQQQVYQSVQKDIGSARDIEIDEKVANLDTALKTGVLALQRCYQKFPPMKQDFNFVQILDGTK